MDKMQAFEVILGVMSSFRGTIQECNLAQEAIATLAKELKYEPKEEPEAEKVEDLEKPKARK